MGAPVLSGVQEHPTARHASLDDAPDGPEALRPVSSGVLGVAPDPAAAVDAARRVEASPAEHLVTRTAGTPGDR